jgi:hypothetical protein
MLTHNFQPSMRHAFVQTYECGTHERENDLHNKMYVAGDGVEMNEILLWHVLVNSRVFCV